MAKCNQLTRLPFTGLTFSIQDCLFNRKRTTHEVAYLMTSFLLWPWPWPDDLDI